MRCSTRSVPLCAIGRKGKEHRSHMTRKSMDGKNIFLTTLILCTETDAKGERNQGEKIRYIIKVVQRVRRREETGNRTANVTPFCAHVGKPNNIQHRYI